MTIVETLGKSIRHTVRVELPFKTNEAEEKLELSVREPISNDPNEGTFSREKEEYLAKEWEPIFSELREEQSVRVKEPSLRRKESEPISTD